MNDQQRIPESSEAIGFYERRFFCFSNFSSFAVEWMGRLWQTSEHAYQAAKFMHNHPEIAEEIFYARSAYESKKIAEKYREYVRSDWDAKKVKVMEEICRLKLEQHPYVKRKLLQTGDRPMVEDSPVDSFWGWGPDKKGRNELGKVWMKLREEIKSAPPK